MRVIQLVNSRPEVVARSVLVWYQGSRHPERSGVPDHVPPRDVAGVLREKGGQKVKAWRYLDAEPEVQPRPRAAM